MTGTWKQWEGHVVADTFELKKYLGGSEYSAVFLTEVRGPAQQPAAIKLIAASPADAELQLARWTLAQGAPHAHLIRISQTGRCRLAPEEAVSIFAVMEYAQENLAEIISERSLTAPEAREMLAPTLDALAFLHNQGLVHGDLKPANVLAVNDQLKLSSDGIARPGEKIGGPGKPGAYDPPEMAGGAASPAADVWSLGMVLAEALTQRVPVWKKNDPADPVLPANLPAPLGDIVRGCLRRNPLYRLTVADIAAQLKGGEKSPPLPVANAKPAPPAPPPAAAQTASSGGFPFRRLAWPAVIAVAAVLLLVAGFALLGRREETKPAVVIPTQQTQSDKPDPRYPSAKTSGKIISSKTTVRSVTPGTGSPNSSASSKTGALQTALPVKPAGLPSGTQAAARNAGPIAGGTGSVASDSAVVRRVIPEISQSARDTIRGTVRINVKVNVDPFGNVMGADFDSPPHSQYIARLALDASQNWKFAQGSDAARQFVVHFEFTNTESRAYATRVP